MPLQTQNVRRSIWLLAATLTLYAQPVKAVQQQERVILLHGLGRTQASMWLMEKRLEKAGFEVRRISYPSFNRDPERVIQNVSQQIELHTPKEGRVHFVGHSLGGLLIRAHFANSERAALLSRVGQVVMIGTPNQGSHLAEKYQQHWLAKKIGGMPLTLGTSETSLAKQLGEPPFKPGIIAGVKKFSLVNNIVGAKNDGVVGVESTKLAAMRDFIELDVGHAMMRYDSEVAEQTIHFLQNGTFIHTNPSAYF